MTLTERGAQRLFDDAVRVACAWALYGKSPHREPNRKAHEAARRIIKMVERGGQTAKIRRTR